MTIHIPRRTVLKTVGAGLGATAMTGGVASANTGPATLFTYDADVGELPENIAIDKRGTKYVSFPPRGEIREISADNGTQSTIATFDIGDGNGVIGLEVDQRRTLYACLVTFNTPDSDTHGVWKVPPGGTPTLFAALPTGRFPNDILLFGDSLLVTDTIGGAVLRVRDGEWSEWVSDPLLTGTGAAGFPFPIGANGIAAGADGTVYVANTEKGHIVEIPVEPDGSAGTPVLFSDHPALGFVDGLAMDTHDNIYAAIIGQNTVVRVSQTGAVETLATGPDDGLDGPSDVTFGTSRGEQRSVFITNFALLNETDPSPSLMLLDVAVPGRPLHR